MTEQNLEIMYFDEALEKVQKYLKIIGLKIDKHDIERNSMWQRLRQRWLFIFNLLWFNSDVVGEFAWLGVGISTGKSFIELTYLGPCLTLCILGDLQAFYFIKHGREICHLIESIRDLQALSSQTDMNEDDRKYLKRQMKIFYLAVNSLTFVKCIGIAAFAIGTLIMIASHYYATGEVQLLLPFLISYPFDAHDIRFWPFVYLHQIWSAVIAVLTVLAPCYLCYACSTFIIYQFRLLRNDFKNIIPFQENLDTYHTNNRLREKFVRLIERHGNLMRCVDLMEEAYTESILFNVVSSSLLICLTGFNVMAISDIAIVIPFVQFLIMGSVQIFFLCYYGDKIMTSSTKISQATYECQWYRADARIVKDLMIISARAQKPCKLTALRFSDVNFKTFTRILSTSWSYFALLTTLYRN